MNVTGATGTDNSALIAELLKLGENQQALNQEDFLHLMLTELQNQDPLEPLDNAQMVDQITQFSILDQSTLLNEGLSSLYQFQATGLIGKTVEGVNADGDTIRGVVQEVVISKGEALLILDNDSTLKLNDVTRVLATEEAAQAA